MSAIRRRTRLIGGESANAHPVSNASDACIENARTNQKPSPQWVTTCIGPLSVKRTAKIIVRKVSINAKMNASGRYRWTMSLARSPSAVNTPRSDFAVLICCHLCSTVSLARDTPFVNTTRTTPISKHIKLWWSGSLKAEHRCTTMGSTGRRQCNARREGITDKVSVVRPVPVSSTGGRYGRRVRRSARRYPRSRLSRAAGIPR
jgi:hypothetical protein